MSQEANNGENGGMTPADAGLSLTYSNMNEPNIRLCIEHTQRIAELFKEIKHSSELHSKELGHTREILSKDMDSMREHLAKDINNMGQVLGNGLNEKINVFARKISFWVIWLAGGLALAASLLAMNLVILGKGG